MRLEWELGMANALSKQKRKGHCLGVWLDVSQDVPGVLQDKPSGCLFTGRSVWLSPEEFLPPYFPTSLPNVWVSQGGASACSSVGRGGGRGKGALCPCKRNSLVSALRDTSWQLAL